MRLALTSRRTRRVIAEDLGIGLSTLTRWLGQDRDADEPNEAPVHVHAAMKRLRRETAVLKQERDILARHAAKHCTSVAERFATAQNLGHSGVLTTLRSYGQISRERLRALIAGELGDDGLEDRSIVDPKGRCAWEQVWEQKLR
jgi:transposase